jgi:hypothetical protein
MPVWDGTGARNQMSDAVTFWLAVHAKLPAARHTAHETSHFRVIASKHKARNLSPSKTPSYTALTLPHREMRDVRSNALRKGWRSEMAFGNTVQKTNRTRPDQTVLRWSTVQSTYYSDQFCRLGGELIL